MGRPKKPKPADTKPVQHVTEVLRLHDDDWKVAFQTSAMRVSFCLALTKPMLEMLCSIADGVLWDRSLYFREYGAAMPNNWSTSELALMKRGLIQRTTRPLKPVDMRSEEERNTQYKYILSPAGEHFVAMLKVTGLFVQADASLMRKKEAT